MFSLNQKNKDKAKNSKPFPQKPSNNNNNNKSKKVNKTVFEDPYHYRIELLPSEDSGELEKILIRHIQKLREKQPFKPARTNLNNVIRFEKDKEIKQKKSPLTVPELVVGTKMVKKVIYQAVKSEKEKKSMEKMSEESLFPQLTIIFYEQKKHEVLEQLLCLLKITNNPYILTRQSQQINRLLGVRTAGSVCIMQQELAKGLLKYLGRSLIDVPWLLDLNIL